MGKIVGEGLGLRVGPFVGGLLGTPEGNLVGSNE